VYQLRVVVAGVSPLIWRRLLVSATTTIAELHAVLRAAFGWSGQNPAPLRHSRPEYGISYVGGPGFRDDAHRVALTDLGLRSPITTTSPTTGAWSAGRKHHGGRG